VPLPNFGLPLLDLLSGGNIGLTKARFSISAVTKFMGRPLKPNSEFGIVVVLVLGALGWGGRKETDGTNLFC